MAALIIVFLNLIGSPLKSKSGLEAENAALRHQQTVLQRKVRGRPTTTAPHLDSTRKADIRLRI
jgi:hypothetical protein